MIQDIKKHYKDLLQKNGPTLAAVQQNSQEAQDKRFKTLFQIDLKMKSLIDVGCGLGCMLNYLLTQNYSGKYLGIDILEDFTQLSQKKFKAQDNISFKTADISTENLNTNYEYILLSGVFNNRTKDSKNFMYQTLKKMFTACKKGVAFNAISTYVEYQDKELYYSNPLEIFDYCKKNFSRNIALLHDYGLYEFTIIIRK